MWKKVRFGLFFLETHENFKAYGVTTIATHRKNRAFKSKPERKYLFLLPALNAYKTWYDVYKLFKFERQRLKFENLYELYCEYYKDEFL